MTTAKVKVGNKSPAFQVEEKQVKRSGGSKVDRRVDRNLYQLNSKELRGE